MKRLITFLFACLILFGVAHAADEPRNSEVLSNASLAKAPPAMSDRSWWDESPWLDPERGFNWYPDPLAPKKEEKQAADKTPPKPKRLEDMKTIEEIRAEVERRRGVAILNPTQDNVHSYLQANNFIQEKSAVFADVARRVIWQNPDVNYEARSPVLNSSLIEKTKRTKSAQNKTMQELAQEHGILFFFRSDCPYCKEQAPILKMVERQYGIPILPVSIDGRGIREMPNARPDNGISQIVTNGEGVDTVPALFLIDRKTNAAVPLATGVIAMEELIERIRVLTTTTPGQEF